MNFDSLLGGFKNKISSYNYQNPSIVGNFVVGNKWNWGLPTFGGVTPQNQSTFSSDIASPMASVSQETPGTIWKQKFEQEVERLQRENPTQAQGYPKQVKLPEAWNKPQVLGSATSTPDIQGAIEKGLTSYGEASGKSIPIQSASPYLAQAGQGLPDPLLPVILSLIETAGGNAVTRGQNNLFNILPTPAGVSYPDYQTAILGGNGQKGFLGVLNNGIYDQYLQSGDLADFFSHYSPPSENASIPEQIQRYNQIRQQYFEPYLGL